MSCSVLSGLKSQKNNGLLTDNSFFVQRENQGLHLVIPQVLKCQIYMHDKIQTWKELNADLCDFGAMLFELSGPKSVFIFCKLTLCATRVLSCELQHRKQDSCMMFGDTLRYSCDKLPEKKQQQEQNKKETRKNKEYMVGQCFCQPDSKLNAINVSTTLEVMSPTVPVKNVITKNIRFPLRPSGKSWISFKRMEGLASQRNSSAVSMGKWLTKLTPWAPAIPALAG